MATNFKNTFYDSISGAQTIPASANATGTISTDGAAVTGTGTLFKTEMPKGSWLTSIGADEIRQVLTVESDTLVYLSDAFTADLAAGTPNVIHTSKLNISAISISVPAAAAAACTVDGVTFPKGAALTFSKDGRSTSSVRDFIDPIVVDATGSTMLISICR